MVDGRTIEGKKIKAEQNREGRDETTRMAQERRKTWEPPKTLPSPTPRPGIKHRWIRTSTLGDADVGNVSSRFREGYVPVRAEDYPELMTESDQDSRYPDGVEIGGLLLCAIDERTIEERKAYHADKATAQMESVDNAFLRENDPRMPLSKPERRSRVTFGSGNKE
jgi:hypothetical protein